MLNIIAYNYVSELSGKIHSVIKKFTNHEKNLRFVIPSRKDKLWFPISEKYFDLWTWNEIYEDVCNFWNVKRKIILSPPDHFLILNIILHEVFNDCPEKIKALPGLTRPGFLNIISSDVRELMNEAVKPSQLELKPESDNPSEFLLPEVYERYIKYLDNYDLLDSAQVCTAALDEIVKNQNWGKDFVIIFTGFMSFNHSQLNLVRAVTERCKEVIILKPEAHLTDFHDINMQFDFFTEQTFTPAEKIKSGNLIEIPVAEPGLEPEVIARTLALYSREIFSSFDEVGLMISNGREAAFAEAFERYKIPYNFTHGIKINQTLPGKVLASIRNLQTRNFPAYETGMLLTQSCFAGIKFPVMRAYKNGVTGLDNWEKFLSNEPDNEIFQTALSAIRSIKNFCGTLSKFNTPRDIMKAFHEFLTTKDLWLDRAKNLSLENYPELDENFRLTASAIQTVGEKVLALDELMPDLGAVQDIKLRNDEAYEFLESWCRNSFTRAPVQISNAVRIFTGQPPVLSYFPIWIMTGVTYKSWSGNISSSPLLGNSEREKLAAEKIFLPATSEKASQREALFRRLIQTGEKLTIVLRPELDEEGRPLSESPFMQRFFDDIPEFRRTVKNSEGIEILIGGDNFTFPEIDAGEKIFREPPKIIKNSNYVGASDIKELLGCSFLWWQRRQAKLYENDSEIVSPFEWGNMLHKYWERVWKRYKGFINSSGKIFLELARDEWKKLLEAEEDDYKKFSKLVKDFRLKRKLKGIKFRVDRLSIVQADTIDEFYSEGYEHENILLEDEAHLILNYGGVKFLGQCDRIEIFRTPEHEKIAFIVDYKEGKGENYEAPMKIVNANYDFEGRGKFSYGLQLSVYAALFNKNFGENIKLSGVYILGLEDGKISGSFSGSMLSIFNDDYKSKKFNEKFSSRIDEGEYAMKCASKILKAGEFSPEYQSDLCRFCHIKSICRKGEIKGEMFQSEDE